MRQLSAQDASFLYSDTTHANANVTLIHIYDQRTAPEGKVRFKSILQSIESRLAQLPVFRQKLHRLPFDLDHPYWVDDENFDLEYHVRHIALPKPGDWRQFCIQASRIHARPLDLHRPLWEIHVIEGLDGFLDLPEGTFALLTKTHHAAIDVEHGSDITALLHDLSATPAVPVPPVPWFPEPAPGLASVLARGLAHTATAPITAAGPLGRALRNAVPAALDFVGDLWRTDQHLPVTRFNAIVSPHRVFETRRFMQSEFEAIRALVPGATVNDAVLAVCGGALRRYLQSHGELPATSLSAMAPLVVRPPKDTGKGLGLGEGKAAPDALQEPAWARLDLGTDQDGAVQRLVHIQAQTSSSELITRAAGARQPAEAGNMMDSMMNRRALPASRAPAAHCTITHVPGPQQPLYLCGARLTYFSAIMPISDGNGLVFAVTSYDGRLVISPTSCRELMPDPAVFAQCLRDSFQEYLALTLMPPQPSPKPRTAPKPARRRVSASGRRSPTRLAG